MRCLFLYLFVNAICLEYSIEKESFYDILSVPNDADTRTIRKAFKKIALLKHPDKNKDNPEAHTEFVRINRAYEVLKDEELRKKYDQYGEEGLNHGNQQYQSWQFYRDNFGIYDDDIEIVTLSRVDFQDEVFESNDFWFINFYSTFCSHCHALAPAWREFAKAIDGIVKVGAVNCAEDPVLCQSQHVMGYPSLVVYPEHIFYRGPRDVESLINFIVSRLTMPVYNLFTINDAMLISRDNGLPFVIEFYNVDKTCLTFTERKKLASMLSDVANFGIVQCESAKEFCLAFLENGVAFYPVNGFEKSQQQGLEFDEIKDIYAAVMSEVAELERIDAMKLKEFLAREQISGNYDYNSLVLFFADLNQEDERTLVEYKKLHTFAPKLKVYLADCLTLTTECYQRLQLKNLPRILLFKSNGGFDMHYGKCSVREVKKFLRKTLHSTLTALTNEHYHKVLESSQDDLLIVDYFTPWCPPCLRMIRELRNMPSSIDERNLRVVTLDCDAYKSICTNLNIKSYPTTVLHADNATYISIGFHNQEEIVEFIEESLNPSVMQFTYDSFHELVTNQAHGHLAMIDFYVGWCNPCQQLAPEFRKLARSFRNISNVVLFGMVDCEALRGLCTEMGIRSYPALRLFEGKSNAQPKEYPPNWWRDFKSMQHWISEQLPSLVEKLHGNFYIEILGSSMPILVDYYAPWCGHCVHFAPILEKIAKLLEGHVRVGKVNCVVTPHLCQKAAVEAYPSLRLYLGVEFNPHPHGIFIQPIPNAEHVAKIVGEILETNGLKRHDEL